MTCAPSPRICSIAMWREIGKDGRSWSEIGAALGVSKRAAQQRFVSTPIDPTAWPKDFDEDARAVVHAAQLHARSFRHRYIGTEHPLWRSPRTPGLPRQPRAARRRRRRRTDRIRILTGEEHSSETATLRVSTRIKRVLGAAGDEARRGGHRCAARRPSTCSSLERAKRRGRCAVPSPSRSQRRAAPRPARRAARGRGAGTCRRDSAIAAPAAATPPASHQAGGDRVL